MLTERCSLSGRSGSVWAAMDQKGLSWASAVEAARMVREGAVTSVELVQACLARVREIDGQVQAWAVLDPEHAPAQGPPADELRMSGPTNRGLDRGPVGLHGLLRTADI